MPTSLSTILLRLLRSAGIFFSVSKSTLSTSAFRLAKSDFVARLDVSRPSFLLSQLLLHDQIALIHFFSFILEGSYVSENIDSFYVYFLSTQMLKELL